MIQQMVSVKGVNYKEIKRYGFKPLPNYVNLLTSPSSEFSFLKIAPPYQRCMSILFYNSLIHL